MIKITTAMWIDLEILTYISALSHNMKCTGRLGFTMYIIYKRVTAAWSAFE